MKYLHYILFALLIGCGVTNSDSDKTQIKEIGAWKLNTTQKHADYIGVEQSKFTMMAEDTVIITQPGDRQLTIEQDSTGRSDFIASFIDSSLTLEESNVKSRVDVAIRGVNQDAFSLNPGGGTISDERSVWNIVGSFACQVEPNGKNTVLQLRFTEDATGRLIRHYNIVADSLVTVIDNIVCDTPV